MWLHVERMIVKCRINLKILERVNNFNHPSTQLSYFLFISAKVLRKPWWRQKGTGARLNLADSVDNDGVDWLKFSWSDSFSIGFVLLSVNLGKLLKLCAKAWWVGDPKTDDLRRSKSPIGVPSTPSLCNSFSYSRSWPKKLKFGAMQVCFNLT